MKRLAASRTEAKQMVERARIILGCLEGKRVQQIARECGTRPNTVIKWRQRFVQGGLAGLRDAPRPGAKPVYGADFRNQVLAVLETPPPAGQACWDGPAVAAKLDGSVHAVWRVLRQEGICLQRQRSWCVSTDKEFAAKAANIVGLYLNPPENALVISVDEKPSIQALERATGYVETDNSKIVRGCKSTYKRHGTLNLFAALQVATGLIQTSTTTLKRREEFLQFMDQIVAETPVDRQSARGVGQLLHSQKVRCLAGPASQRAFSLHANLGQLAKPSRNLVWHHVEKGVARSQFQERDRIAASH